MEKSNTGGFIMTAKRRTRQSVGRVAVAGGSLWSYWPVYVGVSLAVSLVTAGLTLAVHNLKRGQTPQAEDFAEIPPPYRVDNEKQTDVRHTTDSSAMEARERQSAILPVVATRKLMPEMPLEAAKSVPEFMVPAAAPQTFVKSEPLKVQSNPVNLLPAQPQCATALPVCHTNLPTVCQTNLPAAAQNDPTYGTAIHFVTSPIAAARAAAKQDKLVFVLHVSGNFEDPQFT
jgi:hypothetical protein